jgi:hypothetical protein
MAVFSPLSLEYRTSGTDYIRGAASHARRAQPASGVGRLGGGWGGGRESRQATKPHTCTAIT